MHFSKQRGFILLKILLVISLGTFLLYNIKTYATGSMHSALNENTRIFSYEDRFFLVSTQNGTTNIYYIDTNDSEQNLERIFSIQGEFSNVNLSDNMLFITINIDSNMVEVISCNLDNMSMSKLELDDMFAYENSFILTNKGLICYLPKPESNQLYIRDCNTNETSYITFDDKIDTMQLNLSGDLLFVYSGNKILKVSLDGSSFECREIGMLETGPFNIIDDNTIIASDGWVYRLEDDNIQKLFYKGNKDFRNVSCIYDDNLIVNITDNLLYLLDFETGEPISEYKLDGKIVSAVSTNKSLLVLYEMGEDIEYKVIEGNLQRLNKERFVDTSDPLTMDKINQEWEKLKPKNSQIEAVYLSHADLDNFTTAGSVSEEVLNDALGAVNFYRRLYGLNDILLDEQMCYKLQYTAVLCMANGGVSDEKPINMSDDFYNCAIELIEESKIQTVDDLSATIIADQVNYLFNSDYSFRNMVLSDSVIYIGFGLVSDKNGKSVVTVDVNDHNFNIGERNFISYPNNGYYPCNWVDGSNYISVIVNGDLLSYGERSKPSAIISNSINDDEIYFEYEKNLSIVKDKSTILIKFPISNIKSGEKYVVRIEGLYTKEGIASFIEFNFTAFEVNTDFDDVIITSDVYNIDQTTKIITNISPSTTVSSFLNGLNYDKTNYTVSVIRNKEVKTSGNIGTDCKVIIEGISSKKEYTVIIYGDLTGEGNINNKDKSILYNYLLGKENLTGSYLIAADVNHDGKVDTKDLLCIEKSIAQEYEILQK